MPFSSYKTTTMISTNQKPGCAIKMGNHLHSTNQRAERCRDVILYSYTTNLLSVSVDPAVGPHQSRGNSSRTRQTRNQVTTRVAPDTELAGYPAAGYPANLFCRVWPDIQLNS